MVITTDGSISIATFIYDRDLNHLLGLFSDIPIISGFDSGDGIRGDNSIRDPFIIPESGRSEKVYSYRIDGKSNFVLTPLYVCTYKNIILIIYKHSSLCVRCRQYSVGIARFFQGLGNCLYNSQSAVKD